MIKMFHSNTSPYCFPLLFASITPHSGHYSLLRQVCPLGAVERVLDIIQPKNQLVTCPSHHCGEHDKCDMYIM